MHQFKGCERGSSMNTWDSACVHRWISNTLSGKAHINVKASGEMLVRQWLETLQELADEYVLMMAVTLVKSSLKQANCLTRVPWRWFKLHRKERAHAVSVRYYGDHVGQKSSCWYSQTGHLGIKRTVCQFNEPSSINRSCKVGHERMWGMLIHWLGDNVLAKKEARGEKKLEQACDRHYPLQQ